MTFCFNNNNNLSIFVITTSNLTRSTGGEFLSAVVFGLIGIFVGGGFWPEGGFVLDPLSMQSCILRRIDCTSCWHSSGSLRMLSHTFM